jgi:hypothetical protein
VLSVDHETVAASPLGDRLTLVPAGDGAGAGGHDDGGDGGGERGLAASVERGLGRFWGFYDPDAEEGPGALVDPGPIARALRHLADALLAPAHAARPAGERLALAVDPAATIWPGLYPECFDLPPDRRSPARLGPAPRLLVILACGRSGTTRLERLLMAHPLAGGAEATESFLFSQAVPLWSELGRADGLGAWFDRPALAAVLRPFYDELLAATLARHRPAAEVLVEKTPMHTFAIPEIRAVYPDALLLHLLRDGRDVARSVSRVPFFQCPTPADGAALWDRAVGIVRHDCAGAASFREVRYEDVVADPVGETTYLWAWAGLASTPAAEAELRARIAPRVSRHAGTTEAVGTGTWHRLDGGDIAGILAEAGPRLVAEGYATGADLRRARLQPAYWRRRRHRRRSRR